MHSHHVQTDEGIDGAQSPANQYPQWLVGDLRSDHAGETGAVMIYRGILAVSRRPDVVAFAQDHLRTEERHLALMDRLLPPQQRTRLLPLWRVMGWLTGAIPAVFGANAVYATIDAVETFVDHHYDEQVQRLNSVGDFASIRDTLAACQADEVQHRDEARELTAAKPGVILTLWTRIVGTGSQVAVWFARRI